MNTQIIEDFVSVEVAKLLKEKGFNENINTYRDDFIQHGNIVIPLQECVSKDKVKTPTLQMAMKWLREEHNIFIQVDYIWSSKELYMYTFDIYNMKSARSIFSTPYGDSFNSYEEACEVAIKYCLTNLI